MRALVAEHRACEIVGFGIYAVISCTSILNKFTLLEIKESISTFEKKKEMLDYLSV